MIYPKVQFKVLAIEENLEQLVWYAKKENSSNSPLDFFVFLLKLFPDLKGKIIDGMSDEELYQILKKEAQPVLEDLAKNSKDIERYQHIWNKVNDDVMRDLENKLNIKWPRNKKIVCRVGLLPVCPRDIQNFTFDVNYGMCDDDLIATGIHEICHFLYFEKWKEIYPNYTEEEFDFPHIAWYLSEAMIDPLLNNESFKKYTKKDLSSYSVFYETYIEDKSIITTLREYVEDYEIEEAIKKGYAYFQKYEERIKQNNI